VYVNNVHLERFRAQVASPYVSIVLLVRLLFPSEVLSVSHVQQEDSVRLENHHAALALLDPFKMMRASLVAKAAWLETSPYLLEKFNALLVNLDTTAAQKALSSAPCVQQATIVLSPVALRVFPVLLDVSPLLELLCARFVLLDPSPDLPDRLPVRYARRGSIRVTPVRLHVFLVCLEESRQALEELNALHVHLDPTQIHLECLSAFPATLDTFPCCLVPPLAKRAQQALLDPVLEVTAVNSVR
jgi:hypothetical protein